MSVTKFGFKRAPNNFHDAYVMVDVYRMDKAVVMEYQASQEGHIETGNII